MARPVKRLGINCCLLTPGIYDKTVPRETSVKDSIENQGFPSMKIHQISGPRAETAVAGPPASAISFVS